MKKFMIAVLMAATTLATVLPHDAEARRLGGGGSYGRQSQSVTRQAPPAQQSYQQARPATPAAAPAAAPAVRPPSPWRGILGGALLGLGLGALFSHLGIGGAMAGMLGTLLTVALLALAGVFLYRLFMRNKNGQSPRPAYSGNAAGDVAQDASARGVATPEIGSRLEKRDAFDQPSAGQGNGQYDRFEPVRPAAFQADGNAVAASGAWQIPADFDVPGFLRNAKTYFIRLQAAWDRADINDIREFTTPEMFAELRMQIQERGAVANDTDVVAIEAELLGIEETGDEYLASVKFTGQIREAVGAPAEPFAEVWNLLKPASGAGGWTLAGLQQLS